MQVSLKSHTHDVLFTSVYQLYKSHRVGLTISSQFYQLVSLPLSVSLNYTSFPFPQKYFYTTPLQISPHHQSLPPIKNICVVAALLRDPCRPRACVSRGFCSRVQSVARAGVRRWGADNHQITFIEVLGPQV